MHAPTHNIQDLMKNDSLSMPKKKKKKEHLFAQWSAEVISWCAYSFQSFWCLVCQLTSSHLFFLRVSINILCIRFSWCVNGFIDGMDILHTNSSILLMLAYLPDTTKLPCNANVISLLRVRCETMAWQV